VTGPIRYKGQAHVRNDIATLKAAVDGLDVSDAFITAVAPTARNNDRDVEKVYSSREAYLYDVADALHDEYKAITDAGFIVQCDFAALNARGLGDKTLAPLDSAR